MHRQWLGGIYEWAGQWIFIVAWATSVLIYRYKGFDEVEVVQVTVQRRR